MESRRQTSKDTQQYTNLSKARHARTRERVYTAWYIVLLAYGHLPGPTVDVVSGNIGPTRRSPGQGPCQMW